LEPVSRLLIQGEGLINLITGLDSLQNGIVYFARIVLEVKAKEINVNVINRD